MRLRESCTRSPTVSTLTCFRALIVFERICALSGHSKWHNIKLRKGKADAARGARFTKISKEIILAAKSGSSDPEVNYKLKIAVEKARSVNMPVDNIKRAILRAQGGSEGELEEIRYEGHGPGGIAFMLDVATDNRNRTAAELRFIFTRHHGTLGETGSVAWMFEPRGLIHLEVKGRTEEDVTELALVDGVVDLHFGDPCEVITEAHALASVRDALLKAKLHIADLFLGAVPSSTLVPSAEDLPQILALLDALEEHEDVQRVFSNVEFDEKALEALL